MPYRDWLTPEDRPDLFGHTASLSGAVDFGAPEMRGAVLATELDLPGALCTVSHPVRHLRPRGGQPCLLAIIVDDLDENADTPVERCGLRPDHGCRCAAQRLKGEAGINPPLP